MILGLFFLPKPTDGYVVYRIIPESENNKGGSRQAERKINRWYADRLWTLGAGLGPVPVSHTQRAMREKTEEESRYR